MQIGSVQREHAALLRVQDLQCWSHCAVRLKHTHTQKLTGRLSGHTTLATFVDYPCWGGGGWVGPMGGEWKTNQAKQVCPQKYVLSGKLVGRVGRVGRPVLVDSM